MKTVNIHAAKTHLSRLVDDVTAGEEVIIAKRKVPVARIEPIRRRAGKRGLAGILKGKVEPTFDESIRIATKALGAVGFFDLATKIDKVGRDHAMSEIASISAFGAPGNSLARGNSRAIQIWIATFSVSGYSGGYPSKIINYPAETTGYVYSETDGSVAIINYGTEATAGSAATPGRSTRRRWA